MLEARLDQAGDCVWDSSWLPEFQKDYEEVETWSVKFWLRAVDRYACICFRGAVWVLSCASIPRFGHAPHAVCGLASLILAFLAVDSRGRLVTTTLLMLALTINLVFN